MKVYGEPAAMNWLNMKTYSGGTTYLGKDVLGSVRGITGDYGALEDRYEYDAFGRPYKGDFGNGVGLGYTGKPYDAVTGIYNYGYRDYAPEVARFTSEDPIRDGNNWFAYVNNDPVNFVDLWGLSASDKKNDALSSFTIKSPNIAGLSNTAKFGEYDAHLESNVGSSSIGGKVNGLSVELKQDTSIGTFSLKASGLTASASLGFSDKGSVVPGLENIGIEIGASIATAEVNLNYEHHDSGWHGGIGITNGIGFQFANKDGKIGIDIRVFGIHAYIGKK
jgi:RHS repeat-associated protein